MCMIQMIVGSVYLENGDRNVWSANHMSAPISAGSLRVNSPWKSDRIRIHSLKAPQTNDAEFFAC